MEIRGYILRPLIPPKDSLTDALRSVQLSLREGDVVAISSKVVSIDEGRCVPMEGVRKEDLMRQEADWYYRPPKSSYRRLFTIAKGYLPGGAGIDESNGNGHYVLYPKDPFTSAKRLRTWLRKEYKLKNLGVVITDSASVPLRRGAIGFALSWDGFAPLRDYRGTKDLFDRTMEIEVANLVDPLAAAAVLVMGEGDERMPVAVVRCAPVAFGKRGDSAIVPPHDDLFAPLLFNKKWKRGSGRG